jgi:hypothetical protein
MKLKLCNNILRASLMKIRLAGLRFVIGDHLHIHVLPGVGSCCHSFFICFVGLNLNDAPHYLKRNKNLGRCLRLGHGVKFLHSFNGNLAKCKWR